VDVVGCGTFCSGFISMFVFDILQIPSRQDDSGKITGNLGYGQK